MKEPFRRGESGVQNIYVPNHLKFKVKVIDKVQGLYSTGDEGPIERTSQYQNEWASIPHRGETKDPWFVVPVNEASVVVVSFKGYAHDISFAPKWVGDRFKPVEFKVIFTPQMVL